MTITSAGTITTIGTKASVTLTGVNSTFTNLALTTILAGGKLTLGTGQSLTIPGASSNAGTVTLSGGTLNLTVGGFYLPNGENLADNGIKPDVDARDKPRTQQDEALPVALDALAKTLNKK